MLGGLGKFLPTGEGAVKIVLVVVGVLLVGTYVLPSVFASKLGFQPRESKLRPVA